MSKTFFKERKEFIYNIIDEKYHKDIKWALEQKLAKELFNEFPMDFLLKISPPSFFKEGMSSLLWFKGVKGKEYLRKKLKESKLVFPPKKKVFDTGEKVGEDKVIHNKSLYKFLNE